MGREKKEVVVKEEMKKVTKKVKKMKADVKMIHSLRTKILLLIVSSLAVVLVLNFIIISMGFRGNVKASLENSMLDMVEAYGAVMQQKEAEAGELEGGFLEEILKEAKLEGMPSSYTYVVDKTGNMLYHPTKEKIGQGVENDTIKNVIKEIGQGTNKKYEYVTYMYKGVSKCAAYYVTDHANTVVIITADEDDAYTGMNESQRNAGYACLVSLIICIITAFVLSNAIARPIIALKESISKIARFDFTSNEKMEKLARRKDETGAVSRSMQEMRENLRNIIGDIGNISAQLNKNAENLNIVSNSVNQNSSDNSATSQQLAASMQETSATTENIFENIEHITDNTKDIGARVDSGAALSKEIMGRAEKLKSNTVNARNKTSEMYKTVKGQSDTAIKQSKAVDKINVLTDTIMIIADQTSLLALNASIEAARAGESGKGFAVVANEISNLATQSSQTVAGITEIVAEVNTAVRNMSECLEQTLDFIEETVISDYNNFISVSEHYNGDACKIEGTMSDIQTAIDELSKATIQIVEAIGGINTTIAEASTGVTDIAEKTSDIVSMTAQTYDLVQESQSYSNTLKEVVEGFTI